MNKDIVIIGKLLSAHGIKGLIRLESYTENPSDFFNFKDIYDVNFQKKYNIIFKNSLGHGIFLVQVDNINNRTDAENLRNIELCISRKDLPNTEDGKYYYHDLIGLNIITGSNDRGKLIKIYNYGAGPVIDIAWKDGKEESLPFNDIYVKEVNLDKKYVKIDRPEYI